jgi:hypothetical protein
MISYPELLAVSRRLLSSAQRARQPLRLNSTTLSARMLLQGAPPVTASCRATCRSHRCHRALRAAAGLDTADTATTAPPPQTQQRTLTLRTKEARRSLRFCEARVGRNKVVLIEAVATGSEAFAAGARPGDKVVAMSDPVRDAVMWTLSANDASLRFIKDALRLRVSDDITLVLEAIDGAEEAVAAQREIDMQRALADLQRKGSEEVDNDEETEAQSPPPWGGLPTVSQRRNEKRQKRLDEVEKRNDTQFFSALIIGVLATPVIILAVAYTNGWLRIAIM